MPFKSEKQRRFLWAKHPSIAKRWAHEYPESNKNLPTYADDEKKAALDVLSRVLNKTDKISVTPGAATTSGASVKSAKDGLTYVKIPHSEKPTYAGQEREQGEQNYDENSDKPKNQVNSILDEVHQAQDTTDPVLQKLATVLAQPLRKAMEQQQAEDEGRDPRYVPQTMGIKRYALPSAAVPPPIGATPAPAPAAPASPAQPITQPGNTPANSGPVGGGSNPMHNPIQAFGPLSTSGVINGNAAFGVKNSPDSLKTAAKSQPNWYGGENLIQTPTGYYHGYTHGVDVRDEAPGFMTRLFDRDPYILRDDVQKMKKRLRAVRGLYLQEQPHRLEFSHKGQLSPEMRRLIDAALAKTASESGAWTRSEGKNPEGGLNAKGRASLKAQGHDIKAPVTESKPSGERAKRQNSFCSRMCGMKRVNTGAKTKSDPDSRINKSLRKWNCKCGSASDLLLLAGVEKDAGLGDMYRAATDPIRKKVNNAIRKAVLAAGIGGGVMGYGGAALHDAVHAPPQNRPAAVQMAETQAPAPAKTPLRLTAKDINATKSKPSIPSIGKQTVHPETPDVIHMSGPTLKPPPAILPPGLPELTSAGGNSKLLAALQHLGPTAALTAAGAGAGAYQAPQGNKSEGARRGAMRGAATGIGGTLGRMAGRATGLPLGELGGAVLGGGAGYGLAGLGLGKPSWQKASAAQLLLLAQR